MSTYNSPLLSSVFISDNASEIAGYWEAGLLFSNSLQAVLATTWTESIIWFNVLTVIIGFKLLKP